MKEIQIFLKQGRRMVLDAQLLDGPAKPPKGKEGVAHTVERWDTSSASGQEEPAVKS
jgi:hypothetical protein